MLVELSHAFSSGPHFTRVEPAGVLMIRSYAAAGEEVQAKIDETKYVLSSTNVGTQ